MMDGSRTAAAEGVDAPCPTSGPVPSGDVRPLLLGTDLEDYTIAFANGLARHVPVILCVPRRQFEGLAGWFEAGVDVRLLDWPRHRSAANARFLLALRRLIRDERPTVIHLLSNNTLWLNLLAPLLRGTPIVTTVHDVTIHPGDAETARLPAWATRLMARQSGDLVVHGAALRERAAARFVKPAERVHVLPHPALTRYAGLAHRAGLRRRSEGFTVLFFGRIYAYKGLDLLVRAEALARGVPDLRVVIAGRGDDPWQFRDLMGDPGRYDIRRRFIPDAEVAQLFLDADVVALPYAEASQSGVLHVAAAFGTPVIATDVGELGQTVRAAGLGAVVAPGDVPAFAGALARFAADPDLRRACATRALAWAEGETAPARVGAEAVALYRRVAARTAGLIPPVRHYAPGGTEHGGGIGRCVGYVAQGAAAAGTCHLVTDTRGPRWSPLASPPRLLLAVAAMALDRLAAPQRIHHFHLAGRGSTRRKIVLAALARALGVRHVVHLHDYDYAADFAARSPRDQARVRTMFRRADAVIVLGETDRQLAVGTLGVAPGRIAVLQNAVPDPGPRVDVAGGPPRLLFLGRLGERKGVPELLEALAGPEMAELDWTAVLAGDGPVEEYRKRARALGLGARVRLPGWLDTDGTAALCRTSDILVLPSHAEGLSMALLEGLAHGMTVVATRVGAHGEVIDHGVTGLFVPVGDASTLGATLAGLVRDGTARRALASNARAAFLARFDMAQYTPRLACLHNAVLRPATPTGLSQ